MFRTVAAALGAALLLSPALAQAPGAAPAAAAPAPNSAAPAAAPTEKVRVEGFRAAQWGMTEQQVRAAIQKDFNITGDKVKREENLAERTGILTITAPDVLEGAGQAKISYIFGYVSKKLIQVNILWGSGVDPQAQPDKVVAAANQLRQLFVDSGYEPDTMVANAKVADGSIIVFQGEDGDKHTTILRLASAVVPVRGKTEKATETVLSLSYVMDPRNPDIYRLKKGQF